MSDIDEAADPAALIEAYYERGLDRRPAGGAADATRPSRRCWPAAGLDGDEDLGEITGRNAVVSAEKVAINAVMAGCRPEYMPVVVAAVRGLCHPHFAYHGPASSTGGSAMVLVVNGPDRARASGSTAATTPSARATGPTRRSGARCASS